MGGWEWGGSGMESTLREGLGGVQYSYHMVIHHGTSDSIAAKRKHNAHHAYRHESKEVQSLG